MDQSAPAAADPATGLRVGTFALATFQIDDRAFPTLVHSDGSVLDLSEWCADLHQVFDDWEANFAVLEDLSVESGRPTLRIEDLRPLPPLRHPNLLCAGSNNKTHVAQMLTTLSAYDHDRFPGETDEQRYERFYAKMDQRSQDGTPFFFPALHSSLVGATDDVVLPPIGQQHDWELELAVVIGRTGRLVTPDEAQGMIAGYTILNDLGSVDVFRRTDVPFQYDFISKHQPTFKPCGPFIVPAQFLDIDDTVLDDTVRITLSVNGEVMQDWPVNDWIFSPAQYLAYASERVRLLPGDIISLGSPPGNGAHHGGRFLREGDVIDAEITYLGRQHNRCVDENVRGRTPHFGLWKNR